MLLRAWLCERNPLFDIPSLEAADSSRRVGPFAKPTYCYVTTHARKYAWLFESLSPVRKSGEKMANPFPRVGKGSGQFRDTCTRDDPYFKRRNSRLDRAPQDRAEFKLESGPNLSPSELLMAFILIEILYRTGLDFKASTRLLSEKMDWKSVKNIGRNDFLKVHYRIMLWRTYWRNLFLRAIRAFRFYLQTVSQTFAFVFRALGT